MVTLHRAKNWKIAVYDRDHGVPRFHIEGPDFRASVQIETLELIIGTVPPKVAAEVKLWAEQYRAILLATWQELNA
jgi:hypothetical protein